MDAVCVGITDAVSDFDTSPRDRQHTGVFSMTTTGIVLANRRSTGPRSVQGKVRVSKNACKHRTLAETVLLPTESYSEFRSLANGLISDLQPTGATELLLVQTLIVSEWRQLRFLKAEKARIAIRQLPSAVAVLVGYSIGQKVSASDLEHNPELDARLAESALRRATEAGHLLTTWQNSPPATVANAISDLENNFKTGIDYLDDMRQSQKLPEWPTVAAIEKAVYQIFVDAIQTQWQHGKGKQEIISMADVIRDSLLVPDYNDSESLLRYQAVNDAAGNRALKALISLQSAKMARKKEFDIALIEEERTFKGEVVKQLGD